MFPSPMQGSRRGRGVDPKLQGGKRRECWRYAPTRRGKMLPRDTSLLTGSFLVFRFNQSAVATSQAFSHATLNDSLLIL